MKNLFIVLDGIDGSGKGEAIRLLESHYSKRFNVAVTAEPTKGKYGREIRKLLKEEKNPKTNSEHLLELFLKDREEHVCNLITPFLREGEKRILICDRYYYSTIAYQGAQGIDINGIIEQNKGFPKPDVCFILDIYPGIALKRISARGGKEKFEKLEFMQKLRQGFTRLQRLLSDKIIIVDASKTKEEVFCILKKEIDKILFDQ